MADPLDVPIFWSEFLKRLSCGFDPEHDAKIIKSLCQTFGLKPGAVMARLKTYYADPPPRMMQ